MKWIVLLLKLISYFFPGKSMKCHTLEYEKLTFYLSISLILKLEYRQKKKIIIKIVFKFMKKI